MTAVGLVTSLIALLLRVILSAGQWVASNQPAIVASVHKLHDLVLVSATAATPWVSAALHHVFHQALHVNQRLRLLITSPTQSQAKAMQNVVLLPAKLVNAVVAYPFQASAIPAVLFVLVWTVKVLVGFWLWFVLVLTGLAFVFWNPDMVPPLINGFAEWLDKIIADAAAAAAAAAAVAAAAAPTTTATATAAAVQEVPQQQPGNVQDANQDANTD